MKKPKLFLRICTGLYIRKQTVKMFMENFSETESSSLIRDFIANNNSKFCLNLSVFPRICLIYLFFCVQE